MEKIIDIVRDNIAKFDYASECVLYYKVETSGFIYHFPIDMTNREDVGTADFLSEHKAINLMRYLRKASENQTLRVTPKLVESN
jgi:hypothetical protein